MRPPHTMGKLFISTFRRVSTRSSYVRGILKRSEDTTQTVSIETIIAGETVSEFNSLYRKDCNALLIGLEQSIFAICSHHKPSSRAGSGISAKFLPLACIVIFCCNLIHRCIDLSHKQTQAGKQQEDPPLAIHQEQKPGTNGNDKRWWGVPLAAQPSAAPPSNKQCNNANGDDGHQPAKPRSASTGCCGCRRGDSISPFFIFACVASTSACEVFPSNQCICISQRRISEVMTMDS